MGVEAEIPGINIPQVKQEGVKIQVLGDLEKADERICGAGPFSKDGPEPRKEFRRGDVGNRG